jgi:hypothetical protein
MVLEELTCLETSGLDSKKDAITVGSVSKMIADSVARYFEVTGGEVVLSLDRDYQVLALFTADFASSAISNTSAPRNGAPGTQVRDRISFWSDFQRAGGVVAIEITNESMSIAALIQRKKNLCGRFSKGNSKSIYTQAQKKGGSRLFVVKYVILIIFFFESSWF